MYQNNPSISEQFPGPCSLPTLNPPPSILSDGKRLHNFKIEELINLFKFIPLDNYI
jgi:hypothetical protein